jgi:N-acetylmuramoyl-L-alanine amidase
MQIHRRGTRAAVALTLGMGVLAACGLGSSDSGDDRSGEGATPPTAEATQTAPARSEATPDDREPLRGKRIVLDPGHNGGNARNPARLARKVDIGNGRKECDTTGTATAAGYTEHAFTFDVSKRLAERLRRAGAKVTLTRTNDTGFGPCIDERAAIGNREGDVALSVHADGATPSGRGFHVIVPLPVKGYNAATVPAARRLSTAIRDAYHEGTEVPYSTYRGTRGLDPRDDLGGLNLSKIPKVFIECGNMQNPAEAGQLTSESFRERAAESLYQGFVAYFR